MADQNYVRFGEFMPIETLASSYDGPVIMANDDLTIQWFRTKQDRATIDHDEHERDKDGNFLFSGTLPDGSQKPKVKTSKVKPTKWAMARIVD
jgi:hypothetical protein